MKAKKVLLLTGVTSIVGLASLGGVVSATGNNNTGGNDGLVDKIATKFNLDKSEVQEVFDAEREAREAERQLKMEERLTQAVTDGKITEAQKESILAKQAEMKNYLESIKDKPAEERKTLMKEKMEEMHQWAKDNGVTKYFMMLKAGGGHGHHEVPKDGSGPAVTIHGDNIKLEQ
jgi:hypothetical protein